MGRPASSDTVTEGIRVQAAAQYLEGESEPDQRQYLFAYRIRIRNEGTRRARLKSRHWIIVDADNHREDVRGPGVVGKTPLLAPGESFEYSSGCPLRTPWGTMEGSYTMERDDGTSFEAAVGRFFLVSSALMPAAQNP
ncbi:MAG TPA: Co2+/Mg2+ efflux protein ApaG [Planctomycetota bacterium]|nr:Co2+/Mg2+ efflux protein ApaG [Planctomycetota bacterium]